MTRHHAFPADLRMALAATLAIALSGCHALAASITPAAGATQLAATATITGNLRHHPALSSRFLAERRDAWVYLPPGYETSATRYPVLYMHDGNNLFDAERAFMGQEWHVDETAERMIRAGEIPPLIIVGVGNTSARMDEYTWVPAELDGKVKGGKGAQYAQFLVNELKPLIDQTYRTLPDREHTGVMGSSLGGLVSLYLARHHGDVFGKVGAMSPSVWWKDRAVLDEIAQLRPDHRVWLDFGTREGSGDEAEARRLLENARELSHRFVQRGYRHGTNLAFMEDPGATHNEAAWARRMPNALRFLFERSR
jgi:predicted alpha/beta superfamily hydrolase